MSSFTGLDINVPGGSIWIIGEASVKPERISANSVGRRRLPPSILHSV